MDIMVKGEVTKYYKPDQVIINIEFKRTEKTYEKALEEGVSMVNEFVEKFLPKLELGKEELKTRSYRVYEESRYDYNSKKDIRLGFTYSQNAIIKIDYNLEFIAKFIDLIAKLNNPPKCTMMFTVKNNEKIINETLTEAFNNAKLKAEVIANAAGKKLKECIKTDFKPFNEAVCSETRLGNYMNQDYKFSKACNMDTNEIIQNTFVPEDIAISEKIHCLWVTE